MQHHHVVVGRVLVPDNVFERPDMDNDQLMKLINQIQNKINQISRRGGYSEAHKQMQRQLAFLTQERFDEKPFTIGE